MNLITYTLLVGDTRHYIKFAELIIFRIRCIVKGGLTFELPYLYFKS